MKKLYSSLLTITLLLSTAATAATLGLTTQNPTLSAGAAIVDYLEFGGDGDLSSLSAAINTANGVTLAGPAEISLGVGFPLATPTSGVTGFLDIFDTNGQFLSGDLLAVGFTEDVIELQFNNLIGSAAGSFGSSVLALVSFDDSLGLNPFNGLVDGDFYAATINVAAIVSEPHILVLFLISLIGLSYCRHNKSSKIICRSNYSAKFAV